VLSVCSEAGTYVWRPAARVPAGRPTSSRLVHSVWITAALEAPLGRGVNFQPAVPDLELVLGRLNAAGWPLFGGLEERWYRTGARERRVRQFLVQDPDGYLVRPQETLGSRPVPG